ncbi:ABC transporter ATP-binding protein [Pantoea sp. Ap-967]|uniref:ABC transporter ATP-binding protein n=1 Tax=Pantoea sp. Ap-967 TaxID=2608362 RepID=UPI0014245FF3|nr:ABC transporter ATP-binding protein [Pantoea sp. Ap-967]NIE73403.1 ABC transporter ATP-binding protein [Pantoea sp. Ap-967]
MLRVHELTRRFGQLTALDRVSFEVAQGSLHGLIGPNGSGKTTFFNLVTGFLRPSSGRVIWQGQDISACKPHRISRLGMARTFQNTSNFASLSARDNLLIACRNQVRSSAVARLLHLASAVREEREQLILVGGLLERFGLAEVADVPACELPGGTQKVLGVALAMCTAPRLLLLDEPLAGLNPGEKAQLMLTLRSLRDDGFTLLLIEHDMKAIMQACDRITVLCYGHLLTEGDPAHVSQHPETIRAYLGEEAA